LIHLFQLPLRLDKELDGPEAATLKLLQQIAAALAGAHAEAQHVLGAVPLGPQDDHHAGSFLAEHVDVHAVDVDHGIAVGYVSPFSRGGGKKITYPTLCALSCVFRFGSLRSPPLQTQDRHNATHTRVFRLPTRGNTR
jgi:hypothetical protein